MKLFWTLLISFCFGIHIFGQSVYNILNDEGIKKISITLLGRLLNQDEKTALQKLTENQTDNHQNYAIIIDYLIHSKSFYKQMEEQLREEYLEGVSKSNIIEYVTDFYQLDKGRTTSIYFDYFHRQFIQLYQLGQFIKGNYPDSITIKFVQRLLVDNHVYDQINMGTDNYVLSLFQHFMLRKPTNFELSESKKMVEGNPGVLFNRYGDSKKSFLDIFFDSNSYFEGQVRYWYIKIMRDEPNTDELIALMPLMYKCGSPEKLIEKLLLQNTSTDK